MQADFKCCDQEVRDSSSDLRVIHSFFQILGDCSKDSKHNWHHRHLHIPQFFHAQARSKYFPINTLSFILNLCFPGAAKSARETVLFFLIINTRFSLLALILLLFISQSHRKFYLIFLDGFWFIIYIILLIW